MSILLYEHNQKAYNSAVDMLNIENKAAIIHLTGTGKSFIAFKLCEENADKCIYWLSPNDYIFKTQLENIHRSFPDTPILGLSATNIRYLDNQRDMAEELFDGNIASEMTLGEEIVRGILNPPKYVLSVFSYQKDLEKYKSRIKKAKSKVIRDAAQKHLDALKRALEKADYKQQIGLSLSACKNHDAVIFDIVLNIESLYSISDIQEEMGEAIKFYRYLDEENEIINKNFNVIDEVRDCKRLFDELEKTLAASWDYMYRETAKYYKKSGDLLPPQSYTTDDGYKFGQWIVSQRIAYRNKSLNQSRILRLEQIGMSWLTLQERQWEDGFALAKTYFEKYGNLNVPAQGHQ